MITRDAIETAFCFFHQKERVYAHSTMEWQKDDIEYAVASYAEGMDRELYLSISHGRDEFLFSHVSFHDDLLQAIGELERMM